MNSSQILMIPMEKNDADAATIGDYLKRLLSDCWTERDGFDGKRPFGNSGWEHDIYKALGQAGAVVLVLDEYGYIERMDDDQEALADNLIGDAIRWLFSLPGSLAAIGEFRAGVEASIEDDGGM